MKILKYLAVSVIALMATGCSDFLDKSPDERVDVSNMSEDQFVALMRGSYPTANYAWICELSSDNYVDLNAPHLPAKESEKQTPIHFNLTPYSAMDNEIFAFEPIKASTSSDSPTHLWGSYYLSIAHCNQILKSLSDKVKFDVNKRETDFNGDYEAYSEYRKQIDNLLSAKLKAVRAEALVLRAYNHFILVNVFSKAFRDWELSKADIGIPYVKTPENKVMVEYDRGTVASVYSEIKADLMEGMKDISDINCDKPVWRFCTKSANAFAARFSLYTRDYESVIKYANAVLGDDYALLPDKLMDNTVFKGATMSTDYITRWQSPKASNNIMLVATNSLLSRHAAGYRYGLSSIPLREIYYRTGVNWHWTAHPHAIISGALFYRSKTDYGFFCMKIGEEFEYSDKIAGIGYPHIIRREFTGNSLLLERAEAYLMLKQTDKAIEDLIAYDDTRRHMDEENAKTYVQNGGMDPLTPELINKWFARVSNPNCRSLNTWNGWFATMSPTYPQLTEEQLPVMNCLNEMRRYETVQEGFRFLDLKRWGFVYSHDISDGTGDKVTITLESLDPRRAIEVPQECLAAGISSSYMEITPIVPTGNNELVSGSNSAEKVTE